MKDIHPVVRDIAILPTRPLEELAERLDQWLLSRLPGGIVWGHQRMGKTQAITHIQRNGHAIFDSDMPISILNAWDPTYSSLTENRFFREVLEAVGYATPATGTAADKRRRAAGFMIERARYGRDWRYLLFVDEAQWLHVTQMRYLMDLHNLLKRDQVRLVTVLVGQPEILATRESLREAGQNHLLGRFMTAVHRYEGLRTAADLERLCRSFDEGSEYPPGSGISFTAHFVPLASSAGWRLADQAATIWETLHALMRSEQVPRCEELPMQALMAMIVRVLEYLAEQDRETLELDRRTIEEATLEVALLQIVDHAGHKHADLSAA